jgi:hypothetical protein
MPLWFLRGLRRGVVTTRYPARADGSATALPTPPAFRPDALTRELARTRRCREQAPGAVTASGEFELAATDRAHLVKRIPLLGDETARRSGPTAGQAPAGSQRGQA